MGGGLCVSNILIIILIVLNLSCNFPQKTKVLADLRLFMNTQYLLDNHYLMYVVENLLYGLHTIATLLVVNAVYTS